MVKRSRDYKMTSQQGTEKQLEYIRLYNKLHVVVMDESRPYFKKVAQGKIKNKFTEVDEANEYVKGGFIPFMTAIHAIKEENYFISAKLSEFYKINELRNSIAHDNRIVEIIEPTDLAIDILRDTIEKLTNPKKVADYLELTNKHSVKTIDINMPIINLFSYIQEYQYTQFPVFDGEEFKGIISDSGIAYWITNAAMDERDFQSVELSDVTVGEILKHEEKNDEYKIIKKELYLYDALKEFNIDEDTSTTPILLITNDGKISSKDSIIGVLTGYDYLDIAKYAL